MARQPPDLILLDVMMPGMDGYQVADAGSRATPPTKNIPDHHGHGPGRSRARMRGLSAGAEDFLTKPVDRAELLRAREEPPAPQGLRRLPRQVQPACSRTRWARAPRSSSRASTSTGRRSTPRPSASCIVGSTAGGCGSTNACAISLDIRRTSSTSRSTHGRVHARPVRAGEADALRRLAAGTLDRHRLGREAISTEGRHVLWARVKHIRPSRRRARRPQHFIIGHRGRHRAQGARGAAPPGEKMDAVGQPRGGRSRTTSTTSSRSSSATASCSSTT